MFQFPICFAERTVEFRETAVGVEAVSPPAQPMTHPAQPMNRAPAQPMIDREVLAAQIAELTERLVHAQDQLARRK